MLAFAITFVLTATQAEHSKDSSANTVKIEVTAKNISVTRTVEGHGRGGGGAKAVHAFAAGEADQVNALIEKSGLLKAKDRDDAMTGPGIDYSFDLDASVDGKKTKLHLHGPISLWGGNGKPDAPPFAKTAEYEAARKLVDDLTALAEKP
jgi:hypothetical protein